MGSCGNKSAKDAVSAKTAIAVLVDGTDSTTDRTGLLSKKKLLNMILGKDKQGSGSVSFKMITSVGLTAQKTIEFKGIEEGDNGLKLKKKRDLFEHKLDSPYHTYLGPTSGAEHSVIYRNVCQVANELVNGESESQVLVIMSDLVENSEDANFYKLGNTADSNVVNLAVKQLIAKSGVKLPDHPDGLKVVILYSPTGATEKQREKQDADFNRAWPVWKKLFENAGIEYQEPKANL